MSCTYIDTGKAFEVARGHKDLITKLDALGVDMSNMDKDELKDGYIDSDEIPYVYIKKSNRLFLLTNHVSQEPDDYLLQGSMDDKGYIDFTLMYYNGGTCFEEMFEDLVDKIDKEKD